MEEIIKDLEAISAKAKAMAANSDKEYNAIYDKIDNEDRSPTEDEANKLGDIENRPETDVIDEIDKLIKKIKGWYK